MNTRSITTFDSDLERLLSKAVYLEGTWDWWIDEAPTKASATPPPEKELQQQQQQQQQFSSSTTSSSPQYNNTPIPPLQPQQQESQQSPVYISTVRKIGSFKTVQEFWRYFHVLSDLNALPKQTSLQLFRSGIQPLWEDPANARGGRWMIPVPRERAVELWTALVLALLAEKLDFCPQICGVVLSLKPNQATIRLWNRDANTTTLEHDTRQIQELLGIEDMSFQAHQATSFDIVRTFGQMKPVPARRRRRRRGRKHASLPLTASNSNSNSTTNNLNTSGDDFGDDDELGSPQTVMSPPLLHVDLNGSSNSVYTTDSASVSASSSLSLSAPSITTIINKQIQQLEDGMALVISEHDPSLRVVCYKGDSADVVRRLWGVYPNGVLRDSKKAAVEFIGDELLYIFSFPRFPSTASQRSSGTLQSPSQNQQNQNQNQLSQQQQQSENKRPESAKIEAPQRIVSSTRRCVSCIEPNIPGMPQSSRATQRLLSKIAAEREDSWKDDPAATAILTALVRSRSCGAPPPVAGSTIIAAASIVNHSQNILKEKDVVVEDEDEEDDENQQSLLILGENGVKKRVPPARPPPPPPPTGNIIQHQNVQQEKQGDRERLPIPGADFVEGWLQESHPPLLNAIDLLRVSPRSPAQKQQQQQQQPISPHTIQQNPQQTISPFLSQQQQQQTVNWSTSPRNINTQTTQTQPQQTQIPQQQQHARESLFSMDVWGKNATHQTTNTSANSAWPIPQKLPFSSSYQPQLATYQPPPPQQQTQAQTHITHQQIQPMLSPWGRATTVGISPMGSQSQRSLHSPPPPQQPK